MSVKGSILAAAAFVFFGGTLRAGADETFDNFQNYCVATHADDTQSVAAADRAGWMALPQPLLDQINSGAEKTSHKSKIDNLQARMHSSSKAMEILLLADDSSMVSEFKGHMCFVMTFPAAAADFDAQVASLAGVPSDSYFRDGFTAYVWRVVDGHKVQVMHNDPDIKSLFESGALTLVVTKKDEKLAGIALVVPITPSAATAPNSETPLGAK